MKKKYLIGVVMVIVVVGIWIVKSPHELTTTQVLERFSWVVKQNGDKKGVAKFTKSKMKLKNGLYQQIYRYKVNYDDVLTIKNGQYRGSYDMRMEATDYKLVPKKHGVSLSLIRND
ncbi:hypothetical protein [Companilactobacillus bobalius]|uniref:DUF3139 domain-containing protein n=2 Tax=Companilactobacillus bobalius TaxID=2801451 RepID=A0A202FEU1_9LACO|nr:hypothetical protein [Companilactobacillus bobalius]KAE9560552.1 hypothetical protein ATN92_10420 [Companilactobacillus bobalius]KRK83321.1 hypothetical protein FC78_GL002132 [Companilactobacillus bobalius DSM 19674]OVE98985.1 hypothetical protein LKACC16343_00097 [Companilactobacillus bobalius]GEO56961.1 hypothetical protein LBO01_00900 [Companilactobacillus paralimentarius]